MKKMIVVAFVVAAALGACGKKNAPAAPATPEPATTEPAATEPAADGTTPADPCAGKTADPCAAPAE